MIACLSRCDTAGRLVQQMTPDAARRRGHVEQLLVALGQGAGEDVALVCQAKQLGDLRGHRSAPRSRRSRGTPEPRAATEPRDDRGLQRSPGPSAGERSARAEGARHAEPRQSHEPIPVTSRSLKRTLPALGARTPVSRLIRVDLPAPFGPDDRDEFPRRHGSSPRPARESRRSSWRGRAPRGSRPAPPSRAGCPPAGEQAHDPPRATMTRKAEHRAEHEAASTGTTDMTRSWRKMNAKAPSTGPREWLKAAQQRHEHHVAGLRPVGECRVHVAVGGPSSAPPTAP
jgi:hypothetical protein